MLRFVGVELGHQAAHGEIRTRLLGHEGGTGLIGEVLPDGDVLGDELELQSSRGKGSCNFSGSHVGGRPAASCHTYTWGSSSRTCHTPMRLAWVLRAL